MTAKPRALKPRIPSPHDRQTGSVAAKRSISFVALASMSSKGLRASTEPSISPAHSAYPSGGTASLPCAILSAAITMALALAAAFALRAVPSLVFGSSLCHPDCVRRKAMSARLALFLCSMAKLRRL